MKQYLNSLLTVLWVPILIVSVCSCQSGLEYSEQDLIAFSKVPGGQELHYETKKGKQLAFYVAPREGNEPRPLIIVFPGIDSRALDRLDWLAACPVPTAGFLLIDYPGRGRCEGVLRPSRLASTTDGAIAALVDATKLPQETVMADIKVVGHSFGCGAALQFAAETSVRRIVLMAPFTTMKKALFRKMGPLAWLIPDNLDNRDNLKRIVSQPGSPPITIIHGVKDTTIPVSMAVTLESLAPDKVELLQIHDGSHVSILTENRDLMYEKLLGEPQERE